MRSRRSLSRTLFRSKTAMLGCTLVLALIAALPVALAFVPAETFSVEGAGTGTGDLSAAALSSLDRDLQTNRTLPPHARQTSTFVSLTLLPAVAPSLRSECRESVVTSPPASWAPGPSDARHPLLL